MSDADSPVTFETVFAAEVDQIEKAREKRGVVTGGGCDSVKESLIGLAFSGGGIRSATFNLGILQALAKNRLLHKFDYLSSVSGGGYISGWLAALTHRFPARNTGKAFVDVEDSLKPEAYKPGQRRERSFVHWLRMYSDYLTPQSGLLSGDTWAMAGTWLRNTLLNQAVLLLFFLGAFAVCQGSLLALLKGSVPHPTILLGFGAVLWFVAAVSMAMNLLGPQRQASPGGKPLNWWQRVQVTVTVMIPFFLACLLLNFGLRSDGVRNSAPWWQWFGAGAVFYPLAWLVAAGAVRLRLGLSKKRQDQEQETGFGERDGESPRLLSRGVFLVSSAVAGAVGSGLVWVYRRLLEQVPSYLHPASGIPPGDRDWVVAVFGTGALMLVLLATGVLHMGLAGRGCRDLVREWWARLGGYMILLTLGWLFLTTACVFGPLLVRWAVFKLGARISVSGIVAWILANWAGVFAAKSSKTSGEPAGKTQAAVAELDGLKDKIVAALKSPRALKILAKVAPYVFVVGLVLLLATAVHIGSGIFSPARSCTLVLWHLKGSSAWPACCNTMASSAYCGPLRLSGWMITRPGAGMNDWPTPDRNWPALAAVYWQIQSTGRYWGLLATGIGLMLASFLLSWRVDVNDFSMHHFYRNRLVRCYLGASNPRRRAEPFTGLDLDDDLPLHDLAVGYPGPYPILNATLNITAGEELGYATRRAKSFVFTPRYCGYERNIPGEGASRFLPANIASDTFRRTFAPTELGRSEKSHLQAMREKGITLGTAMAISGAAASPNMGYYTSPGTALLMTLFDVRLGWWMGNPAKLEKWMRPGPRLGFGYLFSELFGQSDQNKSFVYLSDGGHFENLAVYELIRRHCKLIVACDADADGKYLFENLLGLIEKARADFGATIVVDFARIRPAEGQRTSSCNYVVGTIYYDPQQPEDQGTFIYIKTSMPPREANQGPEQDQLPDDVWQYFDENPTFPHQSTADQWFNEPQFESYRALGEYIANIAAREIAREITTILS